MAKRFLFVGPVLSVNEDIVDNLDQQRPSDIGGIAQLAFHEEDDIEYVTYDRELNIGTFPVSEPVTTEYERIIGVMTGQGSLGQCHISLEHYFYLVDRLGDEAAKRTLELRLESWVAATPFVVFMFYERDQFRFAPSKEQEQLNAKLVENRPHFFDWLTSKGVHWTEVPVGADEDTVYSG